MEDSPPQLAPVFKPWHAGKRDWCYQYSIFNFAFHKSLQYSFLLNLNLPALSAASLWQAGHRSESEGGNLNISITIL